TSKAETPRVVPLLGRPQDPGNPTYKAMHGIGALWCAGVPIDWLVAASVRRAALPTYPFKRDRYWFKRRSVASGAEPENSFNAQSSASESISETPVVSVPSVEVVKMSRQPNLELELRRVLNDVSGVPEAEIDSRSPFLDQGLDSLSMTQATLE